MQKIEERLLFNSILRTNFKSFVEKVFLEVASEDYKPNWHIDLICSEITKLINKKDNRLIINIPPRYMKSIICSIALPAWLLGHNPKTTIITASYCDVLSEKFALECKRIMETSWYKEIFPLSRISSKKNAITTFETTQDGWLFSTSVSGTLTGVGADFIIIDDPIKPIEASSDVVRDKVNDWFLSTLYSRLNNKEKGKILLIMQRLHENDLTGFLLNTNFGFKCISLPVIAENDEKWKIYDSILQKTYIKKRKKGELLHPERENLYTIKKTEGNIGKEHFETQYQQLSDPKDKIIYKYKDENITDLIYDIKNGRFEISKVHQAWDFITTSSGINRPNLSIFVENKGGYFYNINTGPSMFLDIQGGPDNIAKKVMKMDLKIKEYFSGYTNKIQIVIVNNDLGKQLSKQLIDEYKLTSIILTNRMTKYLPIFENFCAMQYVLDFFNKEFPIK